MGTFHDIYSPSFGNRQIKRLPLDSILRCYHGVCDPCSYRCGIYTAVSEREGMTIKLNLNSLGFFSVYCLCVLCFQSWREMFHSSVRECADKIKVDLELDWLWHDRKPPPETHCSRSNFQVPLLLRVGLNSWSSKHANVLFIHVYPNMLARPYARHWTVMKTSCAGLSRAERPYAEFHVNKSLEDSQTSHANRSLLLVNLQQLHEFSKFALSSLNFGFDSSSPTGSRKNWIIQNVSTERIQRTKVCSKPQQKPVGELYMLWKVAWLKTPEQLLACSCCLSFSYLVRIVTQGRFTPEYLAHMKLSKVQGSK